MDGAKIEKAQTAEKTIGGTTFIITSACSETATETIEQKLERLICRHVPDAERQTA